MTKTIKLYHGTNERIAKTASLKGIEPSTDEKTTLTSVYGAYQAFTATNPDDRWAIVEIELLDKDRLEPYDKKSTWLETLKTFGFCNYKGTISAKYINKVWIYDPRSNWMITRAIIHTKIDPKYHAENQKRLAIINRWLTGDFVLVDDWLHGQRSQFTKEECDAMGEIWHNRSGLDLFYCREN